MVFRVVHTIALFMIVNIFGKMLPQNTANHLQDYDVTTHKTTICYKQEFHYSDILDKRKLLSGNASCRRRSSEAHLPLQ
jgi:hypothetical protein